MMDSLIAELERATEGSRELDLSIARLVDVGAALYSDNSGVSRAPDFTTSLEAALTLAKGLEELCVEIAIYSDKTIASCCWGPTDPFIRHSEEGESSIPALALCIAVLKAQQTMKDVA